MRLIAFVSLAVWGASACASLAPAEPCSSAWYDYEAREAFKPIRGDLARALDRLQGAQKALQADDPGLGSAMRVAFALESGISVVEVTEQRTLPRLQAAAATCDDPGFVRRAVFDFLEAEGVADLFEGEESAFAPLAFALDTMLTQAEASPVAPISTGP